MTRTVDPPRPPKSDPVLPMPPEQPPSAPRTEAVDVSAPLDVERLATAMRLVLPHLALSARSVEGMAAQITEEYARLAATPPSQVGEER